MQTPLQAYADIDGHELFRRAIVDGDELAWAESVTRYRGLLVSWAKRCAASAAIGELSDHIADQAFSRAWAALAKTFHPGCRIVAASARLSADRAFPAAARESSH